MSESFFFFVAPFGSCPVSLVSRIFFAVVPGCAKCFFCCAPLGAATFQRGQSKKNETPPRRVFFLLRPRRKAEEGEAPLGAGNKKKQFAHQGTTAKIVVETSETGHEHKGTTTTKKKTDLAGLRVQGKGFGVQGFRVQGLVFRFELDFSPVLIERDLRANQACYTPYNTMPKPRELNTPPSRNIP